VSEVGGAGTLGTFGHAFLVPGSYEPFDDLGGQATRLFQGSGKLIRTELCPPPVKSLGLQPLGNPPSTTLRVLVGIQFWSRLA
jgi:hypothetical protein